MALTSGCGDDNCGTGGVSVTELVASSADVTLSYDNLLACANNDCPDPDAPMGVTSLTITGTQTDGTDKISLCVPRPDQLMMGPRSLGVFLSMADVRFVDVNGAADTCTFKLDDTRPISGNATALGVCNNGTNPAGFRLDFVNVALSLRRTCGSTVDTIAVTLSDKVAVASDPQKCLMP